MHVMNVVPEEDVKQVEVGAFRIFLCDKCRLKLSKLLKVGMGNV